MLRTLLRTPLDALSIVLSIVLFLALSATAGNVTAKTLYVSSDLGHEMTIVTRRSSAGSNVDTNKYAVYKLGDDGFDKAFVDHVAAIAAAGNAQLHVARFMLGADDDTDGRGDDALVRMAIEHVKEFAPGDLLLVLVPRRMAINFPVLTGSGGDGKAAGLGGYVDPDRDWMATARNYDDAGTLAMFANFRVAVIDPTARRIVASDDIATGEARSGKGSTGQTPWDALTAQQKVELLKKLVNGELDRVVIPQLAGLR